jgi:hypothetical protein
LLRVLLLVAVASTPAWHIAPARAQEPDPKQEAEKRLPAETRKLLNRLEFRERETALAIFCNLHSDKPLTGGEFTFMQRHADLFTDALKEIGGIRAAACGLRGRDAAAKGMTLALLDAREYSVVVILFQKLRSGGGLTIADVATMRCHTDLFDAALRDREKEIAEVEREWRKKNAEAQARLRPQVPVGRTRRGAKQNPDDPDRNPRVPRPDGWKAKAKVAYDAGDWAMAEECLRESCAACGTDRDGNAKKGDALFLLAVLYARRGRTEEAYRQTDLAIRCWVETGLSNNAQARHRKELRDYFPPQRR